MLELVKILAAFLSGGLAAALITEWFRRRREKVQRVQLVERVNRVVGALDGFTLARVAGVDGTLVEVKDVREYQLTLRNSTSIHLQNADVQFEFPVRDVATIASLPAMSRTPLVLKSAGSVEGRMKFLWSIPNFPAGDSVEFTFRAVAAASGEYEAALYNVAGMVIEKIVGEPPVVRKGPSSLTVLGVGTTVAAAAIALVFTLQHFTQASSGEKLTLVNAGGCNLQVISLFEVYSTRFDSPWHVKNQIINSGARDCVVQSSTIGIANPAVVKSGEVLDREQALEHAPEQREVPFSVGIAQAARETTNVTVYTAR
jgi:hypothetical protein